jgi:hypothetical protein
MSVYATCWETCWNGARIGTVRMNPKWEIIQLVPQKEVQK